MKNAKSRHLHDNPAYLDDEQKENPFSVIEFFCEGRPLYLARKDLWELLYAAMSSEQTAEYSPLERADMMYAYKTLLELIEAVYVVYKMKSRNKIKVLFIDKMPNHDSNKSANTKTPSING
jgi:hypothetical protein